MPALGLPATGLPITSGAAKAWLLTRLFGPLVRIIAGATFAVALLRPASFMPGFSS
jgi:hypothetical protein